MEHELIARAQSSGHPLIEGNRVTFLWRGTSAPCLMDDLHNWEEHPQKMTRISRMLWSCSFDLPRNAYLEYFFFDPANKIRLRDPLNPKRVWNGVGGYNHFFYMPEAAPSLLTIKQRNVAKGRVTIKSVEIWMVAHTGHRRVHLYHPPTKERVPLLVVYDGLDYLRRGRLNTIVDNLIAQKRIRPIAMVFLSSDGSRRGLEYSCSDATLAWLEHEVLPMAKQELNLLDPKKETGAFGVLGASFGGLMAFYTGLRLPEIFGRVISQSAVFETDGRDFVAVELIRHAPARPRVSMDIGRLDFLLDDNRRMVRLLRENGFDVDYREHGGAHNFTSWRDHVHSGLERMFG